MASRNNNRQRNLEIQRLEDIISRKNEKLTSKDAEISKLNREIGRKQQEIDKREVTLKTLNHESSIKDNRLVELEDKINALTIELDSLKISTLENKRATSLVAEEGGLLYEPCCENGATTLPPNLSPDSRQDFEMSDNCSSNGGQEVISANQTPNVPINGGDEIASTNTPDNQEKKRRKPRKKKKKTEDPQIPSHIQVDPRPDVETGERLPALSAKVKTIEELEAFSKGILLKAIEDVDFHMEQYGTIMKLSETRQTRGGILEKCDIKTYVENSAIANNQQRFPKFAHLFQHLRQGHSNQSHIGTDRSPETSQTVYSSLWTTSTSHALDHVKIEEIMPTRIKATKFFVKQIVDRVLDRRGKSGDKQEELCVEFLAEIDAVSQYLANASGACAPVCMAIIMEYFVHYMDDIMNKMETKLDKAVSELEEMKAEVINSKIREDEAKIREDIANTERLDLWNEVAEAKKAIGVLAQHVAFPARSIGVLPSYTAPLTQVLESPDVSRIGSGMDTSDVE
ncbi:hypothetical protein HYFRA_00002267 [Hymenoscyphus fraxineus]|uniref:Uncharacterized protein n=1 Tax=Hymenoscyphus fraxineus TaxID=746836 RepID=A0A9N9L604_9HELO|nr:hypothetical protein HYFRA_00002267 [Hymenoscyphus fraxineus]